MVVIELLVLLLAIYCILYYFRRKHKHLWKYSGSTPDNKYNMFYCGGCMRYAKALVGENGKVVIRIFEVKKPRRQK